MNMERAASPLKMLEEVETWLSRLDLWVLALEGASASPHDPMNGRIPANLRQTL